MGVEIERKFLVRKDLWPGSNRSTLFQQGYLSREPGRTVRVRRAGEKAFLTIKGASVALARPEFEYEIPVTDVEELLRLCVQPVIEKRRYLYEHEGHTWEVDEFSGANAGLLVAEIRARPRGRAVRAPPVARRRGHRRPSLPQRQPRGPSVLVVEPPPRVTLVRARPTA